jgi:PemK-like, MazF-like toxin of type II toxin-antitoxin system
MALPKPETGLVISYSYLWRHQSGPGQTEGTKDRPCVIVLAVKRHENGTPVVTVAPITHSPPRGTSVAVEIPYKVKQHLGLDADRSWVVVDEFNEFVWPGFDLRPVPGRPGRYDYGFLPPALFAKIVARALALRNSGTAVSLPRDGD